MRYKVAVSGALRDMWDTPHRLTLTYRLDAPTIRKARRKARYLAYEAGVLNPRIQRLEATHGRQEAK